MRTAVLALVVAAALSARADVSAPKPEPALPTVNAADGVIVDASCFGEAPSTFTPSAADVHRLEAALPRAIALEASSERTSFRSAMAKRLLTHLATDKRFYAGVGQAKSRFIIVRGLCADIGKRATGGRCPPTVSDGGDCVWHIRFDVQRGTFDQLGTNGIA